MDTLCGVSPVVSYAVAGYLALVALLALAGLRAPGLAPVARAGMRVGQLATLVVVLLDVITLLQGHEVDSMVTHVGYAIAAVGLPVILLTRRPEEGQDPAEVEPPHLGVLAVTAAAMVVMVVRLQQTW